MPHFMNLYDMPHLIRICSFYWCLCTTSDLWTLGRVSVTRETAQCYTQQGIHYNDVIMGAIASQITSLTTVYSIVYSDADKKKHQSSASPAIVRGIHRAPVNSPHKWPVTRKMFPFDDVTVINLFIFLFSFLYWYAMDNNIYSVAGTVQSR